MRKAGIVFLAVVAFAQAHAADTNWLTDLPQAEAQAKAENKIVLMDFTGSDWCPGCIELRKSVFESSKFQEFARKNLVLVEVDFPEKKHQTKEIKETNASLQTHFKVEGYPTLIVLDSNGREVGREEGYEAHGAEALIGRLEHYKSGK